MRNMHNTCFLIEDLQSAANSQCVKDIHNKTFNSLAAILNCKVGQLSEKEILARIHLPTGPGLGFVDLRNQQSLLTVQLGCKQFTGSHSSRMVHSTYSGTLNHMTLTRS